MDKKQKRIYYLIVLVGAIYFLLCYFPNNTGAKDDHMLLLFSNDETVIYPIVVSMLKFDGDIHEIWYRLIIYGDYHYGYPFYFLSFLVLLPIRLIFGQDYIFQTQLNLMLLRQFVSVLPWIVATGFATYLQTRFKSTWRTLGLFVFLLAVRGFVFQSLSWWHPDALAVLGVVLTIFFLDRDNLNFGNNFFYAAIACGFAAAVKLVGFFFFLTILGYLVAGLIKRRTSLKKALLCGIIFVLIMGAIIVISNPFLFYEGARNQMLQIQSQKGVELSQGYTHDVSPEYQKGPKWWIRSLNLWFGNPITLVLLFIALIFGSIIGDAKLSNQLILSWVIPYSIYLFYFIAPKPHHYWFPVMLPLFSSAFNYFDVNRVEVRIFSTVPRLWEKFRRISIIAWAIFIIYLFVINIQFDFEKYIEILVREGGL